MGCQITGQTTVGEVRPVEDMRQRLPVIPGKSLPAGEVFVSLFT